MAVFELASPSSSVYCDSPLSVRVRRAERMPQLSCRGVFSELGHWHKVVFRVFVLLTYMWHVSFTPSLDRVCLSVFLFLPVSVLLHHHPPVLCCLSRFLCHSAIQTMSGTMAARIKATGFSRFMMNCRCLTEAASKIHWELKNKPISYQLRLIRVKLSLAESFSLSCSSRSCWENLSWLFGKRVEEFSVGVLTLIYHLDPVHEKVTSLSLTWFRVAFVFSLRSVYRLLNQRPNTDPHSVMGE